MKRSLKQILSELKSLSNEENVKGMARFGINSKNTLGISIPNLRRIAKTIGKDHTLAQKLWKSGIHEARILAAFIDVPEMVTENQMEKWVTEFDSWDICDQVCGNLFDKTSFVFDKITEWTRHDEEFVKRAGFVLMASLAVHDKKADNKKFIPFLKIIKREAADNRNFVRKAVNWALRQIGKRNAALNKSAISAALEIQKIDEKAAKWIAADALKELKSHGVKKRLK